VDAVLRLKVVIEAEGTIVKYGVIRDGESQTLFRGCGRGDEHFTALVGFESLDGQVAVEKASLSMYPYSTEVCQLARQPVDIVGE
jgi:hypothetical protein